MSFSGGTSSDQKGEERLKLPESLRREWRGEYPEMHAAPQRKAVAQGSYHLAERSLLLLMAFCQMV